MKMTEDTVFRTGIDNMNSYYLNYFFNQSRKESVGFIVQDAERFQSRTYREQLLSWQSVLIPLDDQGTYLIYFLDKENPYIGLVKNENAVDRMAWEKFNSDNIASSFLEIEDEKLQESLKKNDISVSIDSEELNERLKGLYEDFIVYEGKLRLYSILFCLFKICVLSIMI